MNINEPIRKQLDKLTDEIENKYGIRKRISEPFDTGIVSDKNGSYVNINYDEEFSIHETEYCFEIKNKRVNVSLFKGTYLVHIAVFD